ncbi:hypothetical protein [Amycolatopsis sp. NPDC051372]|uniref:hypothetical protein n=1 Tax=unclassified Amycolatopsis TaxID=2618356 RepID=UPI0034456EDA
MDGTPRNHHTAPAWKLLWDNTTGPKPDATLPDAVHYSFTDVQAILPQVPADPRTRWLRIGTIDPRTSIAVQRRALASFLRTAIG